MIQEANIGIRAMNAVALCRARGNRGDFCNIESADGISIPRVASAAAAKREDLPIPWRQWTATDRPFSILVAK